MADITDTESLVQELLEKTAKDLNLPLELVTETVMVTWREVGADEDAYERIRHITEAYLISAVLRATSLGMDPMFLMPRDTVEFYHQEVVVTDKGATTRKPTPPKRLMH